MVSVIALVAVELVLPMAQRSELREAAYGETREQWMRLTALSANVGRLQRARDDQESVFAADEERLVNAATPALAASTLQGLVQRYAGESAVQIERIDVADQPRVERPGLLAIPVQLQARGDVAGLVDFLSRLEHGDKLLVIDELMVNAGSEGLLSDASPISSPANAGEPRSQSLSWTLRLHGLYGTSTADSAGTRGADSVVAGPSRS